MTDEIADYAESDAELTKQLFDRELHLRLVIVLTALDGMGGQATIGELVEFFSALSKSSWRVVSLRGEVELLVEELVARGKVTLDGELVRRVR